MDWATIITAVISAISGGGIMSIFYFRENRAKKTLENDAMASDSWQELFKKSEERVEKLNQKIDALYADNAKFRDENNRVTTENAVLSVKKCERNGCPDRIPPRGW